MPLSRLYGGVMDLRNALYERGLFKTHPSPVKTLAVGNLSVGGTGKTPMIELLIRLLQDRHKIVVISRGYGRKSKGLVVADTGSTADEIGDEPLQFFRKFQPSVRVIVAEKRAVAAEKVRTDFSETDLILLDDAYQHRSISRDMNILLTDYNRPFFNDVTFPAGNLREPGRGARRADLVVVTKCPLSLDPTEREQISAAVQSNAGKKVPVVFSSVRYGAPVAFDGEHTVAVFNSFIGMAGLARNQPFQEYLQRTYSLKKFFPYPDHHHYTTSELPVKELAGDEKTALLTTEKDFVKLLPLAREASLSHRCFYIPIETVVHEEREFLQTVNSYLEK